MRRLSALLMAFLTLAVVDAVSAQDFSGTYSAPPGTGATITLVLRQSANGQVTGTLSGNTRFQVQAQANGAQLRGYAVATGGRLYMEGWFQGEGLMLVLAEVGPDGQPQGQTARTVTMMRTAGAALGAVTPQPGAAAPVKPGAPPTGPAAPGRRGRVAPSAPADPYVGTFTDGSVVVTLSRTAQGYTGTATAQGQQMPLTARSAGDRITGVYQLNGVQLPFQAMVQGNTMMLATNEGSWQLQRSGAVPGAPGGVRAPGAGGPAGAIAATTRDREIVQLLVQHEWCTMSYSGALGSSSGTTRYERVVFRGDGSGMRRTSSESSYSNPYGGVASQGQGGERFQWRVQNGVMLYAGEGGGWEQIPLRLSRNSNGYPIVTAGGKDYALCN